MSTTFNPRFALCSASALATVGLLWGTVSAMSLSTTATPAPVVADQGRPQVSRVAELKKKATVIVTKPKIIVAKPKVLVTPKAVTITKKAVVTTKKVFIPAKKIVVQPINKIIAPTKKVIVAPVNPPIAPVTKKVVLPGSPKLVNPVFLPGKLKGGPGPVGPIKPVNFPVVQIGNKVAPVWKGQKFIWLGGSKKFFIPFATLAVVAIGASYYYADGYVALAQPYCSGVTPDGCRLNYQLVDLVGGGTAAQCVQYCPRQVTVAPPRAVAMPAAVVPTPTPDAASAQAQAQPGTGCEVTIFPEENFAGNAVPSNEDQPLLGQSGWLNQIASIQVQAGVWDFYSDEQYQGGAMRLQPGNYPTLDPEWKQRIGSFMCVQPGG